MQFALTYCIVTVDHYIERVPGTDAVGLHITPGAAEPSRTDPHLSCQYDAACVWLPRACPVHSSS